MTTQTGARPVRIGVVGTGFGARVQIPGFLLTPGAQVIAICSGRPERAQATATQFNIHAAPDFDAMLALPDLDAVSIVSPPHLHAEQAARAFQAGKHVLCEKPMARDMNEAKAMMRAALDSNKVAMVDHEFRYVPARARMRELIAEGYLGKPYTLTITLFAGYSADPNTRPFNWLFERSKGGGFLGSLGSHYIDNVREWFGDIAAVAADISTFVTSRPEPGTNTWRTVDADDSFALVMRMANGARAVINVSAVALYGGGERIEAYGSNGALVIDNSGKLYGARAGAGANSLTEIEIPQRLTGAALGLTADNARLTPFVTLAQRFVRAVQQRDAGESDTTPAPSFNDGLRVQEVLDAARQSAETGQWVSLAPPVR